MVEAAWFPRYTPEDRPQKFDQIVQSWDTANKPSELADYFLRQAQAFLSLERSAQKIPASSKFRMTGMSRNVF
jgi:hypothetical protein